LRLPSLQNQRAGRLQISPPTAPLANPLRLSLPSSLDKLFWFT
jgi:hypothetical protein